MKATYFQPTAIVFHVLSMSYVHRKEFGLALQQGWFYNVLMVA